ncbi:MAG: hypothetical protein IJO59_01020 [Clostridia bacterium]|nr:hypothetical protein [Clostridia bacterium]
MKKKYKECNDCSTQLEKLDLWVEKSKTYAVVLIVGVVILGIMIVFACSLFGDEIPGIEEMNLFVSIVLGIVATIVSIVSMLFSFYGLEKTEESERRQTQVLQQILELQKDTKRSTDELKTSMQDSSVTRRDVRSEEQTTNMSVDVDDIDA